MPRQLALDLRTSPALGRADFLVTPANAAAVAQLDRPGSWPGGRLLLVGPEGSGKTHMASFWAAEHGAHLQPAAALRPELVDALLVPGGALVIEDAHRAGGAAGTEQALFHLWNLAAQRGTMLLLTAALPPRDWGLALPDLRSRMDALAQARLGPPDDALLAAVLVKLFTDRQLAVGAEVVAALLPRIERDLALVRRLVAAIDADALARRRNVTRQLALDTLAALMADR